MATGMMHGIKESLYAGETHVDAEYDTAISRYNELDKLTRVVKEAATNYCNAHYTVLANSNTASESFAAILDDPLTETGFETLSKQMLAAHSQLNADRQSALTARMSEGVLVPLEKLHLHLLELHTKTTKREELHKNLQYYLRKVGGLVRDREERGAKGKIETDSQKDKLTRNQLKLDTVRQQYTQYTQPLIVELSAVWNTRTNYLGPVLAAFAGVEKEFARVYTTALDEVHTEVVETAQAKRMHSVLPAVEGSSIAAPEGLNATPIHTNAIGTVNATQSMLVQKAQDPTAIQVSSVSGLAPVENIVASISSSPSHAATSTVAPLINDNTRITAHGTTSAPIGVTSGEIDAPAAPSKKTQRAALVNAAQAQVEQPGVIVTEKDVNHAIQDKQHEQQRKEDEAKRARELQEKEQRRLLEEQNSSIPLATSNLAPIITTTATTVPITTTTHVPVTTTTVKSAYEDESKSQRFETDQKTASII